MSKTDKTMKKYRGHILINYIAGVRKMVKYNKDGTLDFRTQPAKTVYEIISSVEDKKLKHELWEELKIEA